MTMEIIFLPYKQISIGSEAHQVIGPATASQLKSFTLYQHLQEIHNCISFIMSGLPTDASDVLSPSLGSIYVVACNSVMSLFQAMPDRLEACILQIHEQNFGMHGMDAAMDKKRIIVNRKCSGVKKVLMTSQQLFQDTNQ